MPSFLDTLQPSDGEPGGDAPLDVLTAVKAEGGQRRRRRHRRNAALSGLALALVAVPTFAALGGSDGGEDVRSTDLAGSSDADDDRESGAREVRRTTTSTTAPVTEVAGVVVTQVPEPPAEAQDEEPTPTTARPPRTTVPPTTAPPLVCENSFDPACGDFHWSPEPAANQPLVLAPPAAGPDGKVHVAPGGDVVIGWSDADGQLEWYHVDPFGTLLGSGCSQAQRHGPWAPPAPNAGSGVFGFTFDPATYPSGSEVTLGVSAASGTLGGDCDDPYRSEAQILVTVVID